MLRLFTNRTRHFRCIYAAVIIVSMSHTAAVANHIVFAVFTFHFSFPLSNRNVIYYNNYYIRKENGSPEKYGR